MTELPQLALPFEMVTLVGKIAYDCDIARSRLHEARVACDETPSEEMHQRFQQRHREWTGYERLLSQAAGVIAQHAYATLGIEEEVGEHHLANDRYSGIIPNTKHYHRVMNQLPPSGGHPGYVLTDEDDDLTKIINSINDHWYDLLGRTSKTRQPIMVR